MEANGLRKLKAYRLFSRAVCKLVGNFDSCNLVYADQLNSVVVHTYNDLRVKCVSRPSYIPVIITHYIHICNIIGIRLQHIDKQKRTKSEVYFADSLLQYETALLSKCFSLFHIYPSEDRRTQKKFNLDRWRIFLFGLLTKGSFTGSFNRSCTHGHFSYQRNEDTQSLNAFVTLLLLKPVLTHFVPVFGMGFKRYEVTVNVWQHVC